MKREISFFQKKLAFLFPLSIFIMVFDHLNPHPTVNITIYAVLIIPIIIVVVIILLGRGKIKFNLHNPMFILLFVFMLCILISTLFATYQETAMFQFRRIVELVILAFVMFIFIKNIWQEKDWILFSKIMMITGVISGLSILTDIFGWTHFYLLYRDTISFMRPFGILGASNYAAGKLGVFLPFAFFCIVNYRHSKKYFQYSLSIIFTFLIMIAIFFTGSRMGGFIAVFSLFLFLIKEINQILHLRVIFPIIIIISIIIFINFINPIKIDVPNINYIINSYISFIHFITTGEEILGRSSLSTRSDMIKAGLNIFIDYPIFGVGLGNYKYVAPRYIFIRLMYYSHNTFITILSELGLVGFLFFIFICFKIINNIYYFYKNSIFISSFYFYLGLSFVNFLIISFFLHNVTDKYFWGMFIPISMLLDYWRINRKDSEKKKDNLINE